MAAQLRVQSPLRGLWALLTCAAWGSTYYGQCQSSTTSTVVRAPLVRASLVKRHYIKYLDLPLSFNTGQRRITWPCDLDLWPWSYGACRWYSICVPSFKFVGLFVRKICRTSGLSISRHVDRDLWPLTLKLVCTIARGLGNLAINFGVSVPLPSRHIGQYLSDESRDLATLTFHLGACRWYGFSYSVWIWCS